MTPYSEIIYLFVWETFVYCIFFYFTFTDVNLSVSRGAHKCHADVIGVITADDVTIISRVVLFSVLMLLIWRILNIMQIIIEISITSRLLSTPTCMLMRNYWVLIQHE